MRQFFVFLLLILQTVLFAQPSYLVSSTNLLTAEKRGAITQLLGNTGGFSLSSQNFTTSYARCFWNINPAINFISGSVTYLFTITKTATNITFDMDDVLQVDSVIFQKNHLSYLQKTDKTLTLNFTQSLLAGYSDSITIYYQGAPITSDFGSFVTQKHGNNIPVMWTLSEPYGARDWWPCRNGLNDKIDSIDIYIKHSSAYAASANGVLVNTVPDGGYITSHFQHRYPIATYLVGIAVTNYITTTHFLSLQTGTLPVTTTVYPEYAGYFETYVPKVYDALQLYDANFGAYPFMKERYGQTEFDWAGGIEHQTNSFINNADEYLMAHELAHQWFGDKITVGSWQDIWLNEGFATYLADIFYTEHLHPENLATVVSQDMSLATSEPDGSVWVEDTTNVDRIFSNNLSYKKGALLLRMLRWTLGDSVFFSGVRRYAEDPKLSFRFARTDDLQRNLEAVSHQSLTSFFTQWFYGKGYPSFNVQWNYKNGEIILHVTETTSNASNPLFTVPLQLVFRRGAEEQSTIINIQQTDTKLSLPLFFKPDSVLIDPAQFIISKNNTSVKDTNLSINTTPSNTIGLHVYPNPANTFLHIQLGEADSAIFASLKIINSAGTVVYKKTYTNGVGTNLFIPVQQLAQGVYYVQVQTNKGTLLTKKFIKQ